MGERRIITLPFGEGLQRSDGVMVVQPNSFADLRNVYQYEGKAQVREGMSETSILVDDLSVSLDMVLAIHSNRAERAGLAVGFDEVSYEMFLNRMTIAGTNPVLIGSLGTPPANGLQFDPPIIHMADSDNKVFIAHDEPNIGARLATQYYDPFSFPQIQTLQADFTGDGDADVLFRGVARHLSYIFGWGYGNADDPDRGDVVRVSNSGDPRVFQDFAFFEAGQRAEPVMTCRSAGRSLLVFKETETYEIFGYSPDTFGIRPADTLFGCVGSRLAVSVSGTVFFWSTQGPRVSTGAGSSQDIAVPLDIEGPDPATLVAESDPQNAFAEYDPKTRTVLFVWGQRVYALSIRNPSRPRWSYYELGETAQCGAQLFTTQAGTGGIAPTGYPGLSAGEGGSITEDPDDNSVLILEWVNNGLTGGEIVEIRYSTDGGVTYSAAPSVIATGATQQATVRGLLPNVSHKFSLRYQRGGLYTTTDGDWSAIDPDVWDTALFRGQNTGSTGVAAPVPIKRGVNNGLWQATGSGAHTIEFGWTIPAGNETLQIEVERRIRAEGDASVQDVDGRGIGPPDTTDPAPGAFANVDTLPAGTVSYKDLSPTAHRWNDYRLRFVGGAYSDTLECWAGPDAPQPDSFECTSDGTQNFINTSWSNADAPIGRTSCPGPSAPPASHVTQGYYNNMTNDPSSNNWLSGGSPASAFDTGDGATILPPPLVDSTPVRVGLRHQVTCFGTVYPSYWARVTDTPNYRLSSAGTIL